MENNLGNKETMAKNIKRYMFESNVSSVEMCRILNVPESTFSYWINAKTYPRIDKIEKMANFFGISKSDLVEDHPYKEKPAEGEFSGLSEGEIGLISYYRVLNDEGKKKIYDYAKDLSEMEKYKKAELLSSAG